MLPKLFFAEANSKGNLNNLGQCCVLMPFAHDFDPVYEAIKSAVEGGDVCFHCSRADEFLRGGTVMEDVWNLIAGAEIVIADLSKRNPNVFYELGVAHMVKEPEKVILIMQEELDGKVPFDVAPLRRLSYTVSADGLEKLKRCLVKAFREIGEYSWQFSVADGGSYEKQQKIVGLDREHYTFGLSDVLVAKGGAKFQLFIHRFDNSGNKTMPAEKEKHSLLEGEAIEIPHIGWKLELQKVDVPTAKFGVGRSKTLIAKSPSQ